VAMSRRRRVTKTILLLPGVALAVSAGATEPVGYEPEDYGYYGYYGDDGFVFAPGHGRFHGHRGHGFAHGPAASRITGSRGMDLAGLGMPDTAGPVLAGMVGSPSLAVKGRMAAGAGTAAVAGMAAVTETAALVNP
jgi:hypothetical protein